ncbi:DHA2 family efflux MFS transporter permease subunit [Dissulfurirhabdus thermomarina]|uniref:DHA2 family efflux MFS transporter permease subunit n=1 Tax=Dissulfurirhabdus thermomarina TaxID=1765737 RepID=A0A6N9TR34_DISTH|nr:DHA2 family efflux MFS transporter permease subunit [Dissulfurirhabdus thermomarina]NDY42204.1 DHA2 family efflux MFS transporter permease subunit [Dissulfurirhabdus thermomarina]NMX22668.1 DHA2 family efflux MFS transporter permease subunit [Dissulfurirhabdus thermomarina]
MTPAPAANGDLPVHSRISPAYRAFLTMIVMVGAFMAILDTTVVDVVVPKMMGPLSTDLYGVQWVITAYMIAAAVGLLLTHNLGNVLGLKWLFLAGLAIFTGASALCGTAGSLAEMIGARVLQGLGEAFIMASAQTILFLIYPPEKHGLAMGIYAMGVSFAPSIGPTVGGWITEHLAWRWVFYINLPVGVLNLVAGASFIPVLVKHRQRLRFNFVSYAFLGTFTVLLLVLLSKGQQLGWSQSTTIVLLGFGAAAALVFYLLSELHSRHPLIDPALFRHTEYTLAMGFFFLVMGLSIYQVFYLLPLYYETLKGLGTFSTGLHMLAFAMFIAIFSPLAGILSDRFGPARVLAASTTLYLFTSYFLIPSLEFYTPSVRAALLTIPLGIALGAFFAPVSALALGRLGEHTALGVSLMHYLRFVGGSLGTAIATNTLEHRLAVHQEGIALLQNRAHVETFLSGAAGALEAYFPPDVARAKAAVLLGFLQQREAASLAFQDTFRHSFLFGLAGSLFLVLLLALGRGKPRSRPGERPA